MRKAALVTQKILEKNIIFDQSLNRDDMIDKYIKLRDLFKINGFNLSTSDINKIEDSEIIIYGNEMPSKLPNKKDIKKSFIILSESHFIFPKNFDKKKHKYFNKIFTWNDDYVDGNKYIKLNLARKIPTKIEKNLNLKKKLCTMITANKYPPYKFDDELYSKRIAFIRWFEKNSPNDFDLYGTGWDEYRFRNPKILRILNRIPSAPKFYAKLFNQSYPSYRGSVKEKLDIMKDYKFSISFENAKNIPGYISEKIFHSFFASCVPIYWGANNVLSYIPKNCFIDFRDFKNYNDVFKYIKNISEKDYMNYLDNIELFLNSEQSTQFNSNEFAKIVVNSILDNKTSKF